MARQNYNTQFQVIDQSGTVRSDCAGITFINTSLIDTITVNTFPIKPGASLSIDANENELDTTVYQVKLGTDPNTLWVIKKIYV